MRGCGTISLAAMAFLAVSMEAQEPLPASYRERLATLDRVERMTQSDVHELTSKAKSGAPDAQYVMALLYEMGQLVPRDGATAHDWMQKSADQGFAAAETAMGSSYLENHDTGPVPHYADADRWLRMAATQGDAEAQLWLGSVTSEASLGESTIRSR